MGLDKKGLRLIIAFITEHCSIRLLLSIWNKSQPDHGMYIYCDEKKSWTIHHPRRVLFEGLDYLLRADIKALHRLINRLSWLTSARTSRCCALLCFVLHIFLLRLLYLIPIAPRGRTYSAFYTHGTWTSIMFVKKERKKAFIVSVLKFFCISIIHLKKNLNKIWK